MAVLLAVAKNLLIPGSTWFLVTGVGVALLLLYYPPTFRWGRRVLGALFVLYVAFSLPVVADTLDRTVAGSRPIAAASEAGDAPTIVLLGNGGVTVGPPGADIDLLTVNTALNVSEAVRLYRLLGGRTIIASGGIPLGAAARRPESEMMREHLLRLGVKPADIVLDPASANTLQQAQRVAALLPRGSRVLLVTTPAHAPRAVALFRTQGLEVVPAVSASRPQREGGLLARLIPDRFALRASEMTCYELIAYGFYRLRGDIAG